MKMKLLAMLMLLFAGPSSANEISHITVRNHNFEIVKVIDDKVSLQLFEQTWETKVKLKPSTPPAWLFKIDISREEGRGGRWLYDPTSGYVTLLSKLKVPIYKIPALNSFNKLLGIHNNGVVAEAVKGPAPHTP
jgi:hypothetical protein